MESASRAKFSYAAGFFASAVGIVVLLGWQFNLTLLKSFLPGAFVMKANTGVALLLTGIALLSLQQSRFHSIALTRILSTIVVLLGLLTIAEYVFGWSLGIDESLFRESGILIATSHAGRMAPNTAVNFVLIGFSVFLLTFDKFTGSYVVEFPLVCSFVVSALGFVGYVTGLLELTGPVFYTQIAPNTAATFMVLCVGILFTSYGRQQGPITIEHKIFAGLTAAGILVLLISTLSIVGIRSLLREGDWVHQTYEVKNEIGSVLSHILDVQSSERGFLVSGEPRYLSVREVAVRDLPAVLVLLRQHTVDRTQRHQELDSLERLVNARIAFSDNLVGAKKASKENEVKNLFKSGRGKAITDSIRTLIARMIGEEDRLLQTRNIDEERAAKRSQNIIYVSVVVQALLLAAVFLVLNSDLVGRKKAEEALRKAHDSLEERVKERTSELLETNDALRNAENRYRTTLDHMLEGCQIIGFDWRYLYLNDVAALQGKRRKDELIGRTMMEMYPGIDNTPMFSELKHCMDQRVPHRMENEFRFPDGSVGWFALSMEPVPEGVFILSSDITKERQLNEELKKHQEHLEELVQQRTEQLQAANQELEAFSYSVSHDLRAPLRHINGFVELLFKKSPALDQKAGRFLEIIADAAKQMGNLIDDLLVFSRLSRAELTSNRVDMNRIVMEVISSLNGEIKDRKVDWEVGRLHEVNGDPAMLRVVMMNLVSNALKYSRPREPANIRIASEAKTPGEVVFSVADNGVGFDMKYADKLFGVFQRLHSSSDFEGTGIGLATVRRVIHRHGGRTWAEGALDRGATVYFTIPFKE